MYSSRHKDEVLHAPALSPIASDPPLNSACALSFSSISSRRIKKNALHGHWVMDQDHGGWGLRINVVELVIKIVSSLELQEH